MRLFGFMFFAAALVAAHAGCKKPGLVTSRAVVAVVGQEEITRDMVKARAKALRAAQPSDAKAEALALAQIIQGYLAAQILDRYGIPVSEAPARAFWPDQPLPEAVRAVTQETGEALFLSAFAKPDFATWLIDYMFPRRPDFLQKESETAMRIHTELLNAPAAIDMLASREGLAVARNWIGNDTIRPLVPANASVETREYSDEEKREAAGLYGSLAGIEEGQVFPNVVNTANAYLIFRVERRTKNEVLMAAISVPKPTFHKWFLAQAAPIEVDLRDRDLGEGFLRAVPWARRVNIKNKDEFPGHFLTGDGE